MIDLVTLKDRWVDTPQFHKEVKDYCTNQVNENTMLKEHRDYVENNVFGFGERAFHWLWKMLVDEMPSEFSFLEIGIFKGNSLSIIKSLAMSTGRKVKRYGVTPLSTEGGVWESDYAADIKKIHDDFHLPKDYVIYHGLSEDKNIIEKAKKTAPYNILYIDGGHERRHIDNDLTYYAPLVKRGGYLVIDDCANDLNMNFGEFQGIQPVTDGVLEYMKNNHEWEFCGNVVHIKVYKRL